MRITPLRNPGAAFAHHGGRTTTIRGIGEGVLLLLFGCVGPTDTGDAVGRDSAPGDSAGVDSGDSGTAEVLVLGAVQACGAPVAPGWTLAWGGVDMGPSDSGHARDIEPGAVALVGDRLFGAAQDGGVIAGDWRVDEYASPTDWSPIVGGFSLAELDEVAGDELLLLGQTPGLVPGAETAGAAETVLLFEPLAQGFVRDMVPADFDGDGLTDLFVQFTATGEAATTLRPVLALNKGGGAFVSTSPVDEDAEVSGGVGDAMMLDADADGDPDVLVCHNDGVSTSLQLLVNDGGSFSLADPARFDSIGNCRSLALGPLGPDGRPGIVATFPDRVELWNASESGWTLDVSFVAPPLVGNGEHWTASGADLDNDGDGDFVVAEAEPFTAGSAPQPVVLAWNDGDAYRMETLVAEAAARALLVRDLNDDGVLDIVVGDAEWTPRIFLSDGCSAGAWLDVEAPSGTRVVVTAGGEIVASGEVTTEAGAGAAAAAVLHLGLGSLETVDQVSMSGPWGVDRVIDGPLETRRVVRWTP